LGGVFIYASIDKIAFPDQFALIVNKFGILPDGIARIFAFILPWLELILGILMIVGLFIRPTAAMLSLILMVFIAAVVMKPMNGTLENCGCFSTSSETGKQSVILLVTRNILLIAASLYLFFNVTKRSPKEIG